MNDSERKALAGSIRQALRMVLDPELGESVVDLGLIYTVAVDEDGGLHVEMTTTTAGCPAAAFLREAVESAARTVAGTAHVEVSLVYTPRWSPDMMNAMAKAHLGHDGRTAAR